MRRLMLGLTMASVAACVKPVTSYTGAIEVSGIDFRRHSLDGFLFTPNAFMGEHTTIGMVSVTVFASGARRVARNGTYVWDFGPIPVDSALTVMKSRVRELGGDALINFTIEAKERVVTLTATAPGLQVTGLAIKRAR